MAESARIVVSVLESPYTSLLKCGVPLPLCLCLQGKELMLETAQWTAKQSNGGFSVTFFWPALRPDSENTAKNLLPKKKSKQRKSEKRMTQPQNITQKARKAVNHSDSNTVMTPITSHQSPVKNSAAATPDEPSKPDPTKGISLSETAVDLTSCDQVRFELRNHVPGLSDTVDGNENWTPVKKKRKQHRKRLNSSNSCIDDNTDSSGSELDITCSRLVEYTPRDGVPGLTVYRRNSLWTPIKPSTSFSYSASPVASRTRSRTLNT